MLIARYLCSNRDTTRGKKRGKRIRIERDRSIEVHALVPVTRIPRRGTSPMVSATSNREGWFTSVFPRRLDLPLAKPTTAESKPIRADQRARVDGSVVIAIFKLRYLSIASSGGPTLLQHISVSSSVPSSFSEFPPFSVFFILQDLHFFIFPTFKVRCCRGSTDVSSSEHASMRELRGN